MAKFNNNNITNLPSDLLSILRKNSEITQLLKIIDKNQRVDYDKLGIEVNNEEKQKRNTIGNHPSSTYFDSCDEIYCNNKTGAKVYVGNVEAANNTKQLNELQIFNIVDCRAGFSKPFFHEIASNHNKLHVEDSFNNWDMLIKNSPKTRRRFRFQVERHWSYHYDPIKNKIISCDDNKVLVNNCPPFSTYSSSVFLKEETTILKQEEEEEEEGRKKSNTKEETIICKENKQEQIQNTLYQAHYVKVKDNNDAVVLFFQPIFDFIDQLLCNGKHVLIHCLAGAHRAGTTAIAYLMYKKKISLQKAIVLAKLRRSVIDPVGSFPALLIRLELGLSTRKKNDAKKYV